MNRPDDHFDSRAANAARFTTTCWRIVLAAGQPSSPECRHALASLCQVYWLPLYAYARRRVTDRNEAEDLTQAFFAELLEKDYLRAATPHRGRFRAFLLTAFKHFLSKQWAKAKAQKRGGGRTPLSLDFEAAEQRVCVEPCAGRTPRQEYDRQWAVQLLAQVLLRLEQEFAGKGKGELLAALKPFLLGTHGELTYAAVAARLDMTEAAVKMAASRMRRRYRELLREEIAQTVPGPEDVEEEIRLLFAALAR